MAAVLPPIDRIPAERLDDVVDVFAEAFGDYPVMRAQELRAGGNADGESMLCKQLRHQDRITVVDARTVLRGHPSGAKPAVKCRSVVGAVTMR